MKLTEEQLNLLPEELQKVIERDIIAAQKVMTLDDGNTDYIGLPEFADNAGDDMSSYTQPPEITEEYEKIAKAKEDAWLTSQMIAEFLQKDGVMSTVGFKGPGNVKFIGIRASASQSKYDEFILEKDGCRISIKREDLFILS